MIVKKNEFFGKKGENKKVMDAKLTTFSQFFWKLKFQVKNVRRRRHQNVSTLNIYHSTSKTQIIFHIQLSSNQIDGK